MEKIKGGGASTISCVCVYVLFLAYPIRSLRNFYFSFFLPRYNSDPGSIGSLFSSQAMGLSSFLRFHVLSFFFCGVTYRARPHVNFLSLLMSFPYFHALLFRPLSFWPLVCFSVAPLFFFSIALSVDADRWQATRRQRKMQETPSCTSACRRS